MTTKLLLASALIALLVLPAGAQQAPQGTPTRIRGTVEKLDGQALTVKSREGQPVTIALADISWPP
jgi:endonuclease YncB( thermonuclease family)